MIINFFFLNTCKRIHIKLGLHLKFMGLYGLEKCPLSFEKKMRFKNWALDGVTRQAACRIGFWWKIKKKKSLKRKHIEIRLHRTKYI